MGPLAVFLVLHEGVNQHARTTVLCCRMIIIALGRVAGACCIAGHSRSVVWVLRLYRLHSLGADCVCTKLGCVWALIEPAFQSAGLLHW